MDEVFSILLFTHFIVTTASRRFNWGISWMLLQYLTIIIRDNYLPIHYDDDADDHCKTCYLKRQLGTLYKE